MALKSLHTSRLFCTQLQIRCFIRRYNSTEKTLVPLAIEHSPYKENSSLAILVSCLRQQPLVFKCTSLLEASSLQKCHQLVPDTNVNVDLNATVDRPARVHELVLAAATANVLVTVDVAQTVDVPPPNRHAIVLHGATVAHHVLVNSNHPVIAVHHVLAKMQLPLQLLLDKLQVAAAPETDQLTSTS